MKKNYRRFFFISLFATALITILYSHPMLYDTESGSAVKWNKQEGAGNLKLITLPITGSSLNARTRYTTPISMVASHWQEIKSVLGSAGLLQKTNMTAGEEATRAALVNFNSDDEVQEWGELRGLQEERVVFTFDPASERVHWEDLFPEWIDEEGKYGEQRCPALPMPRVQGIHEGSEDDGEKSLDMVVLDKGTSLDMVVAKLPCITQSSRDVARLHVQLAAAHVAVSTGAKHVLLLDSCSIISNSSSRNHRHSHLHRPLPNLFACDRLVATRGPAWIFLSDLPSLQTNLALPIGSCRLATLPSTLRQRDRKTAKKKGSNDGDSGWKRREAYATILHSAESYICGAIALARSIRLTRSKRDLVILVDANIEPRHHRALKTAGWRVVAVERIRNPMAKPRAYNEWNYSKFRLWQLTMYDKIIFLDADLLVLRNIDFLFDLPQISATANNASLFNSGVMVIEPSLCTFMDNIHHIVSYNGGDQGFLNEIFPWWHRISKKMNYLKYFWIDDSEESNREKTRLFGADPPELFVLHYLGLKPWLCFRDYDCNWNVGYMRKYASDVAHNVWWKVHDTLSLQLQQFCILSTKQKATLEWHRRQAKNASFPDGHWRRKISDPRLHICRQKVCNWKTMLLHWGKG